MRNSIRQVQVALVLVSSALMARAASAQLLVQSVAPSIGMGIVLPYGRLGQKAGTGLAVTGGADMTFTRFPVLLRPELNYVRFSDRIGRDEHQISGSLNLVVPARHGRVSPFAIVGLGVYHLARNARSMSDGSLNASLIQFGGLAENDLGIDAGAGVDFSFGFMRGRLDARYARVSPFTPIPSPKRYFPVTLSFQF